MSGFEVAGIVLAVLPLCISAIEHYKSDASPFLGALFKYHTQLSAYGRKLKAAQTDFATTVKLLCLDAGIADDDQFVQLRSAAVTGSAIQWQDPDHERKLVRHLGKDGYETYTMRVYEIYSQLSKVVRILGLDENASMKVDADGNVQLSGVQWAIIQRSKTASAPSKDSNQFRELKSRFKLIVRGNVVLPALQAAAELNVQLDEQLRKSSRLAASMDENAQRKNSLASFIAPLHKISLIACRLHDALQNAWRCSKHTTHRIGLKLETRIDTTRKRKEEETIKFDLAVRYSDRWAVFELCATDDQPSQTSRTVRFTRLPSDLDTLPTVANLCDAVQAARCRSLGRCFALSYDGALCHQSMAEQGPVVDVVAHRSDTLKNWLRQGFAEVCSLTEQAMLGLTIAASFLQLQSTPWLNQRFDTEHVILLTSSDSMEIRDCYVSRDYPGDGQDAIVRPCSDREKMLALCIMLYEICTGSVLEGQRGCRKHKDALIDDDALRLQMHINDQTRRAWLPCFQQSIAACLAYYKRGWDLNLSDNLTRKDVIQRVIQPFASELLAFDSFMNP